MQVAMNVGTALQAVIATTIVAWVGLRQCRIDFRVSIYIAARLRVIRGRTTACEWVAFLPA
jgi:hypothetical protein